MKKTKRIIAAVLATAISGAVTTSLNAAALAKEPITSQTLEKELEGYTLIEDDDIFSGWGLNAQSYIDELGRIKIVEAVPNSFIIELSLDVSDNDFEDAINTICPEETYFLKSNDSRFTVTKLFSVYARQNTDLTLEQAKQVYETFKDKVLDFKYYCDRYTVSSPNYSSYNHAALREGDDASVRVGANFTLYIENNGGIKEKLQSYIDENNEKCHIETYEKDIVDVVPDTELTYLEEISLANRIFRATELHPWGVMVTNLSDASGGVVVDMKNSVSGDANCDNERDMADVVFIMQALANPNKYQLTVQGSFNADIDNNGITVGDAQIVQEMLLGLR